MKLAYFGAEWCGVCREKTPLVHELAKESGLPLEVLDYDDPAVRERADALRVKTVPTLALMDGERARFKLVGTAITPENVAHLLGMFRSGDSSPEADPTA